jgi:excisionase family DNA binding protein
MRKKPTNEVVASRDPLAPPQRLAYRVDEACALLGVSRDTIERAVKAGRLKSGKGLGRRLIDAESLRAMYDDTSSGA